ncbi:MAG: hypothetical protein FD132_2672, partial [bacterium]
MHAVQLRGEIALAADGVARRRQAAGGDVADLAAYRLDGQAGGHVEGSGAGAGGEDDGGGFGEDPAVRVQQSPQSVASRQSGNRAAAMPARQRSAGLQLGAAEVGRTGPAAAGKPPAAEGGGVADARGGCRPIQEADEVGWIGGGQFRLQGFLRRVAGDLQHPVQAPALHPADLVEACPGARAVEEAGAAEARGEAVIARQQGTHDTRQIAGGFSG